MSTSMNRILSTITLLLAGCAAGSDDPTGQGGGEEQPHQDTPAEAFQKHCSACHGPEGVGSEYGPQIQNPVVDYAMYVTRTGRNEMGYASGMKGFPAENIPDEDMLGIIEFLREAKKPKDGEGLYVRFCANCHGAAASGGRVDKALLGEAEGDEFAETIREGEGDDDYGDREEYMPSYPSSELTDEEVELIRVYVESLGPGEDDDEEEEEEEDEDEEEEDDDDDEDEE